MYFWIVSALTFPAVLAK